MCECEFSYVGPSVTRTIVCTIICCGASKPVLLTKYYSSDTYKKDDMGRAYGTREEGERCIQGF
jgi:hypothetical protein